MNAAAMNPVSLTNPRKKVAVAPQSVDKPQDELVPSRPASKWPAALACSLIAVSGAAHASTTSEIETLDNPTTHELVLDSKPMPQQYFAIGQQNDSMPAALNWLPTSASNRNPLNGQMDDNGWTAEVRADYARTSGNSQWVGELRDSMVTQRGSWIPGPNYHGYRTDFAELAVQKNTSQALDDNTTLYTGYGGGAQIFGPMGGHDVQLWVHTHLPFGGRHDNQGLQTNYTTHSLSLTPEVNGGVGISRTLNQSKTLSWNSTLEGTAAVGEGYSTARADTGLNYAVTSRMHVGGGLSVNAVYDNQPATSFMHDSGLRLGEYVQADMNITKNSHIYGRVQLAGVQGEPLYTLGFSFGGGSKPWLDPIFR